ncbi:hypothetical protein [Pyxidicoccus xibeiensis]|uniref:hypothetical protein n=1 Tax=Pyxidicoccus xibeiensis TaxID=2906759 RepID=UPI0020A7F552|nr:hypothetical protein [Pyxidicoccus xibeiensis]MCP3136291.1 hypothetical protein [Pyxidicoccus xibeiensis]
MAALATDASAQASGPRPRARGTAPIRLLANENPSGPSASARRAMQAALGEGNRYARNAADLEALVARRDGLTPAHVILTSGSQALRGLRITVGTAEERARFAEALKAVRAEA